MKLIDVDAFKEWLKAIPLKDLSDGLGLCRVIMEEDFKKAIKNMPEKCMVEVRRHENCESCKYFERKEMED